MEGVEDGSGAQCLRELAEDVFCRLSTVDNQDWYVSELDLVDITVGLRPLPVLFRRIVFDVGDVADQRKARRTSECW